jgi:glutathione synthase/RimK-type ligase-like ATP-grasp enzyme
MLHQKIAYLCSAGTMPGSPSRRTDAWEHDLTIGMLGMGLHSLKRAFTPVLWDDESVDFKQFECAIIGTTWDYAERCEAFLQRLQRISKTVRVLNEPQVIAWNARKTYLRELEHKGCPVIPTLWLESAVEADVRAGFDFFQCEQIVVKPQVGAGAWRQVKLARNDEWPSADLLAPGALMVQPFLPAIVSEGEFSLIYFNRRFSHAVRKIAADGDYRIQSTYGGSDVLHVPTKDDLLVAEQALRAVDFDLLYARVDLVRAADGQLRVMELELIEPYLYPIYAPHMGEVFAKAYQDLLGL